MAQSFYPVTPVDITPGTAGSWVDVDVSANIPAGATGVIIHVQEDGAATNVGLRKNGSTDDRYARYAVHGWAMIGVDANRVFEAKIGSTSTINLFLVGYTTSGVTFATNATDKTPTADAWRDIDCSVQAPSATGLIFELTRAGAGTFGLRKNGSTDNRVIDQIYHGWAVIGCDTSQICEGYQAATTNFYLVGYITDGVTFNTNATDLSLGSTAAWTDLAAIPAYSVMGIIECFESSLIYSAYGLRKNGSAEDIYLTIAAHPWAIVECDASKLIEGKIAATTVDFFLVGYATEIVIPTVTTQAATNVEATSCTGNGNITNTGGVNCTRRGFCYKVGTSGDPTTADSVAYDDGSFGTGAYTKGITGLTQGTSYRVRAYAVNSAGTGYGATVDVRTKLEAIVLSDSLTISDIEVGRSTKLIRSDTLTVSDIEIILQRLTSSFTFVDSFSITDDTVGKNTTKNIGETITLVESVSKYLVLRTLSDSLALADSVIKQFSTTLTDTIELATESLQKIVYKMVSDTISLADTVSKSTSKVLSDTTSLADTVIKQFSTTLSDVITIASAKLLITRIFSDTLTLVDSVSKFASFVKSDSATLSDTVVKQVNKTLSDTVALSVSLVKKIFKTISDVITIAASHLLYPFWLTRSTITFSEALKATVIFDDALRTTGTFEDAFKPVILFKEV